MSMSNFRDESDMKASLFHADGTDVEIGLALNKAKPTACTSSDSVDSRFAHCSQRFGQVFPRTIKQRIIVALYTTVLVLLGCSALNLISALFETVPNITNSSNQGEKWSKTLNGLQTTDEICPQIDLLSPSKHAKIFEELDKLFQTDVFKLDAIESLGGAVRIPTETFDNIGPVGEDPRWEIFDSMHYYLAQRFPLLHLNLKTTKVHTYALVYHWQGSNSDLKPILLTAHQDVVPVEKETLTNWIQPPFSGYYDGTWIWGRGSCDDKSGLIAIMTAVEVLLAAGFEPTRSVVLAFGMDEERWGPDGAGHIAPYLEKEYGHDAFALLIDEGGGYTDIFGGTFAVPSVAEKGKLDIRMEVSAPGGHSSVPPKHTTIGILARLITELEANPHPTHIYRDKTFYKMFQCLAEYGSAMPDTLRQLIKDSRTDDEALKRLEEYLSVDPSYAASIGTTQAVDLVGGGVKVNALPEKVFAVVNHRIADYSSVEELRDRFVSIVAPVAQQYNLSVSAFGTHLDDGNAPTRGILAVSDAFDDPGLQPAPVSPTSNSGPWEILSGTIRYVMDSAHRNDTKYKDGQVYVAPGVTLGNTDTRYYWNLTNHIFRYNHRAGTDSYNGAHTVNEALRAEGYIEMIRFFTAFILNADEADILP